MKSSHFHFIYEPDSTFSELQSIFTSYPIPDPFLQSPHSTILYNHYPFSFPIPVFSLTLYSSLAHDPSPPPTLNFKYNFKYL